MTAPSSVSGWAMRPDLRAAVRRSGSGKAVILKVSLRAPAWLALICLTQRILAPGFGDDLAGPDPARAMSSLAFLFLLIAGGRGLPEAIGQTWWLLGPDPWVSRWNRLRIFWRRPGRRGTALELLGAAIFFASLFVLLAGPAHRTSALALQSLLAGLAISGLGAFDRTLIEFIILARQAAGLVRRLFRKE